MDSVNMHSLEPSDVAKVLKQALSELGHVKQQLKRPYVAKETLAASITKLENDIKQKGQELLLTSATQSGPSTPSLRTSTRSTSPAGRLRLQTRAEQHVTSNTLALTKQASPPQALSAVQRSYLDNPTTEAARAFLEERFGIPGSSSPDEQVLFPASPGSLSKGITMQSSPSVVLPKAVRADVHAIPPPDLVNAEIDKGLFHVLNRGMLPAKTDLTPALCGDHGPYKTAAAQLHPYGQQHEFNVPSTVLEGTLKTAQQFKLDLVTPVIKPKTAHMQVTLAHLCVNSPRSALQHLMQQAAAAQQTSGTPQSQPHINAEQPAPMAHTDVGVSIGEGTAMDAAAETRGGEGEAARPWERLMDSYSLHEVLIRKGATITSTPEFESYYRTYAALWDAIGPLLLRLEAICQQYMLPLAIVDGPVLAQLAANGSAAGLSPLEVALDDLLLCLKNVQDVAALMRQPGRRFLGPPAYDILMDGQGQQQRIMARRMQASSAIQAAWRNSRLRLQLKTRLQQARSQRAARFLALQEQLKQQWPLMQRHPHVVIHIPSLRPAGSSPPDSCSSLTPASEMLSVLQACQLPRLADLAEPLVDMIIILPRPLDDEVASYWNKILQVGGVNNPASRYRVVYPDSSERLPVQMSVVAQLLASSRSVRRLRAALNGRLAYIVPGILNEEIIDLSVALNCPVMASSSLSAAKALATKSGARVAGTLKRPCFASRHRPGATALQGPTTRVLFEAVGASIPPGCRLSPWQEEEARQISLAQSQKPDPLQSPLRAGTEYRLDKDGQIVVEDPASDANSPMQNSSSTSYVLTRLCEMVVQHPHIYKWLLKIDDELMGCGIASLELAAIKGAIPALSRLARRQQQQQQQGTPMQSTAGSLNDEQQVAMVRLYDSISRHLHKKLQVAAPEVYPSAQSFIDAFATRGGVIEANPPMAMGSPAVNLFIDPLGAVSLLSTQEKVFQRPLRSVGSTFPQTSVPHKVLLAAATAIGTGLYAAGIIGHVCVDWVSWQERDESLRLWALGIQPCITPSLMAFQLADFLAAGSFDASTGLYIIDPDESDDEDNDSELERQPSHSASAMAPPSPHHKPSPASNSNPTPTSPVHHASSAQAPKSGSNDALYGLHPSHTSMSPPENPFEAAHLPNVGSDLLDEDPQMRSQLGADFGLRPSEDGASPTPAQPAKHVASASGAHSKAPSPVLAQPAKQAALKYPHGVPRVFFCLDAIMHPVLRSLQCSKFFHKCWQHGLCFDVDNRTGVIFNLCDRHSLGAVGVTTVGLSQQEVYAQMRQVMTFIATSELTDQQRMAGVYNSRELALFSELSSLVKYLAEESAKLGG